MDLNINFDDYKKIKIDTQIQTQKSKLIPKT